MTHTVQASSFADLARRFPFGRTMRYGPEEGLFCYDDPIEETLSVLRSPPRAVREVERANLSARHLQSFKITDFITIDCHD